MNFEKIWIKSMKLFAPTCHQQYDRSFVIYNYQLPFCARCTGLYIGYIIGILFTVPILFIFAPLTYIDGFIQLKTSYESTNFRRLTTGIISGIGIIELIKLCYMLIKAALIL